jgi:protein-disulfide isomerase
MKRIRLAFALLATFLCGGAALAQNLPPTADLLADRVLGDPKAPITVIDYASLTCSHCAAFHTGTLPEFKKNWIDTGKAKLIYRDFPLDRYALRASKLARCLGSGERYFNFLDVLFKGQASWLEAKNIDVALTGMAKLAGLSQKQIEACDANKELAEGIVTMRQAGSTKYNVESTPTIIINDKPQKGGALSYEDLNKLLKAAK